MNETKTEQAKVTIDTRMLDGFSVELTIETTSHLYSVEASWSAWSGWDTTITDEMGDEHDADALADALGFGCESDMLATLTENIYLTGDRELGLAVKEVAQ